MFTSKMIVDLSVGYWVFTSIGVIASVLQTVLDVYILHKYVFKHKTWNKVEYQLILFRVLLDALNGFFSIIYFSSTSFTLIYSEIVPFDFSFVFGLIGSNFLEMRSFLAAIIAVERTLAAIFPLDFYRLRSRISNIPIFLFIFSIGFLTDIVLIGVCEFRLPLTPGCNNFACATPSCYQTYSSITRMIYSSTNALFSAVLCYKLFLMRWKQSSSSQSSMGSQGSTDFRKANWLSLTDGLSTFCFDLLPVLIVTSGGINIRGMGPVIGAFRQTGRVVEAAVMVILMEKGSGVEARVSVANLF